MISMISDLPGSVTTPPPQSTKDVIIPPSGPSFALSRAHSNSLAKVNSPILMTVCELIDEFVQIDPPGQFPLDM